MLLEVLIIKRNHHFTKMFLSTKTDHKTMCRKKKRNKKPNNNNKNNMTES